MAQHDYVIANGTGAAVRSDLNNGLAAIISNNSGATEPTTMYAYQWWADTTTGLLKQRNAANSAWVTVGTLASANLGLLSLAGGTMTGVLAVTAGTAALPGIAVSGDLDSGLFSPGANQVAISTNGTSRLVVDASGNVNIDSGVFYADAANNRVGINTTSPVLPLQVNGSIFGYTSGSATGRFLLRNSTTGESSGGFDLNQIGVDTTLYNASNGSLSLGTNNTPRATIDSSGRLLVGTSTSVAVDSAGTTFNSELQVAGSSASVTIARSVGSGNLFLARNQTVNNGSPLGFIGFQGGDGTNLIQAASIQGVVDGTSGANDMPGRLVFSTTADGASSPTERLRIDSGGTTKSTCASTNFLCVNTGGSGTALLYFQTASVELGKITHNGSNSVTYATSSDYRLKENVVLLPNGIARVKQLKPSSFNFLNTPDVTVDGFLAHEAQEIVPECATGFKDEVDENGKPVYQGIDQGKLVPLLTAALQEAIAKIEALETRITAAGIA